MLYEKDMIIKYVIVHHYGLNVLFNRINVLKTFRNRVLDIRKYTPLFYVYE